MSKAKLLALCAVVVALTASAQGPKNTTTGQVKELSVPSTEYHRSRRVWVYTPPGYSSSKAGGYPLIVAFDGSDYIDSAVMALPKILDSLASAGSTPAFVAVLIDDSSSTARIADLGNSARFQRFLGGELVPWVRRGWNVSRDPHRTIVTGSSAGGLAAAYAAFKRPDLFGNVLSQSGAFWRGDEGSNGAPYEWLTGQVRASPKADVQFLLDVGALETGKVIGGTGPRFIDANRRFRDALVSKGYPVAYTEVPRGFHSPESWRPRLAGDIVSVVKAWRNP